MARKPWLIMLCFYFGRWPAWINFFIESCKWNPEVRWRICTDCGEPENHADNVEIVPVGFQEYQGLARRRLGVNFTADHPYKLCDLRPCLGYIHEPEIAGFPYFGYGDIDVIYGRIASFYGPEIAEFDVVSTHPDRLSGHFAIFRNTPALRRAFERVRGYRRRLEALRQTAWEEGVYSRMLRSSSVERCLFTERYSTVLSRRGWHDGTMNYPKHWFWRNGRLTNDQDDGREFLYLHFMRWHSAHWINVPPEPGEAAWVGRDIIQTDWRKAAQDGFCIGAEGFLPHPHPALAR